MPAKGHTFEDGACIDCGEPEVTYTVGDVNDDGVINGKDSHSLKMILGGVTVPTDTEKLAADINRDGILNGKDSNFLSQYNSGFIGGF